MDKLKETTHTLPTQIIPIVVFFDVAVVVCYLFLQTLWLQYVCGWLCVGQCRFDGILVKVLVNYEQHAYMISSNGNEKFRVWVREFVSEMVCDRIFRHLYDSVCAFNIIYSCELLIGYKPSTQHIIMLLQNATKTLCDMVCLDASNIHTDTQAEDFFFVRCRCFYRIRFISA